MSYWHLVHQTVIPWGLKLVCSCLPSMCFFSLGCWRVGREILVNHLQALNRENTTLKNFYIKAFPLVYHFSFKQSSLLGHTFLSSVFGNAELLSLDETKSRRGELSQNWEAQILTPSACIPTRTSIALLSGGLLLLDLVHSTLLSFLLNLLLFPQCVGTSACPWNIPSPARDPWDRLAYLTSLFSWYF
jgi:hypothetical protein